MAKLIDNVNDRIAGAALGIIDTLRHLDGFTPEQGCTAIAAALGLHFKLVRSNVPWERFWSECEAVALAVEVATTPEEIRGDKPKGA